MTHSIVKKGFSLLASAFFLLSASACSNDGDLSSSSPTPPVLESTFSSSDSFKDTVTIAVPASPAGIPAAVLLEKSAGDAALNNYVGNVLATDAEVSSSISNGDADVALLPFEEAVRLYQNSDGEIQLLALLSQSDLSIVTADESIVSFSDLSGKKIAVIGENSFAAATLQVLIEETDLDISMEFSQNEQASLSLLQNNRVDALCLNEPATTTLLSEDTYFAPIQLSALWNENFPETPLPYSCLVVKKGFADSHIAKMQELLEEFSESTVVALEDPMSMSMFVSRQQILSLDTAEKILSRVVPVFYTGEEMKTQTTTLLELLSTASPTFLSTGVPDETFYRTEELIMLTTVSEEIPPDDFSGESENSESVSSAS